MKVYSVTLAGLAILAISCPVVSSKSVADFDLISEHHETDLSRATEEDMDATCPCFEKGDLKSITKKILDNSAALRPGTCPHTGMNEDFEMTYTVLADGVVGGYGVIFDVANNQGSCLDYPGIVLGPFPIANVTTCKAQLETQCTETKEKLCPCLDLEAIVRLQGRLANDPKFAIDIEKSCRKPDMDGSFFGLYQTIRNSRYDLPQIGISRTPTFDTVGDCYQGSDAVFLIETEHQFMHCASLLDYLCSGLNIPKLEELSCKDEEGYMKDGKVWKTCENIIGEEGHEDRSCTNNDSASEKRVFQHCRASCGTCKCMDDPKYFYNGQEDKGCDWIAEDAEERCEDEGAAKHCIQACSSKCCIDSSERRGNEGRKSKKGKKSDRGRPERGTCRWLMRNPSKNRRLCARRRWAAQCPLTCLKCEIMPR